MVRFYPNLRRMSPAVTKVSKYTISRAARDERCDLAVTKPPQSMYPFKLGKRASVAEAQAASGFDFFGYKSFSVRNLQVNLVQYLLA